MKWLAAGVVGLMGLSAGARAQDRFAEITQVNNVEGRVVCRIRALVNGEPIFDDEIRDVVIRDILRMEASGMPDSEKAKMRVEIWRNGLDSLVEREVIYSEAHTRLANRPQIWNKLKEAAEKEFDRRLRFRKEQAGNPSDQEFKAMLEAQGMTLEKLRRAEERQFISQEFVRSMIFPVVSKVGHEEMRQYYEEHPADFTAEDKIVWQDIFIDAARHPSPQAARLYAEQIIQRAKNGEDFVTLVKQYDNGDSSFRKGEGIGQRPGEIRPPECEAPLFQMQQGEIGPLIEMANGFHIIRLVERQYAGKVPFDAKTQETIRRKLQNAMAEREMRRVINEMKRKATIQLLDTDG
jgi:parvulin-like peptidyl-prolyl isomerase